MASIVHADQIGHVVRQFYAVGSVKQCTFISQGINDTYLIKTDHSKFIARLYRHLWRNRAQIDCEIDFVAYLAARAAPVAQFIAAKDGTYLQTLQCPEGERFLALMECASGSEYESHAIPQNGPFNYGKAVGLLHNATSGFTATNSGRLLDTQTLIWQPLHRVEEHFAAHTADLECLRNFACQLTQEIATLDTAELCKMFIHGDLTGGNGNQDTNGNHTLFDFDCCGFGWQAYDLAVFLWSLMQNNRVHLWSEFLEGYRSEAPLDQNDENSIGLFVAARSYWIMGYSMARVPVLGSHSYGESLFMGDVEFIKNIPKMIPKNLSNSLTKLTKSFGLPDA